MSNAPRLLIVSRLFPPSRRIGARRPERLARHLAERGWDVTVLTLRENYALPIDAGFTPPPGVRVVRTHAFIPGNALRAAADAFHRLGAGAGSKPAGGGGSEDLAGWTRSNGNGVGRPLRDALWRNVSRAEFPDRWIGWTPFALAAMRRFEFDVVLATLPPYTPALIAQRIARRDGAVLALDYRDPWTEAPRVGWDPALYEHLLDRHRRLEDACLRDSDVILSTSPTICRWLAPRAGFEPVFAPNSFDARQAPDPSATRSRSIVYTGSLAYGRTLAPILAAMARLPGGRDGNVELVYAGSDGAILRAEAERLGLTDRVRDLGYLPAKDAARLLRGALAAVVLVTPGYEYMLPGKMFEVLAAGAPMLLVAPQESDAAAICREHRLGWHHVPEDLEGIAASLRQAATVGPPSPVGLESLQTDHVIDTVDAALREAFERKSRSEGRA